MTEPRFTAASRDWLARGHCDYWDPDDEVSRARAGYFCPPCKQEADRLLEQGIVRVAEERRSDRRGQWGRDWRASPDHRHRDGRTAVERPRIGASAAVCATPEGMRPITSEQPAARRGPPWPLSRVEAAVRGPSDALSAVRSTGSCLTHGGEDVEQQASDGVSGVVHRSARLRLICRVVSSSAITDWDNYSEFSEYDLGQAVAHMSFQAQALGLHVRQFRAFDRAALAAEFDVPQHWEVTTMSAIGRVPADIDPAIPAGDHPSARRRRSLNEIRWPQAGLIERR